MTPEGGRDLAPCLLVGENPSGLVDHDSALGCPGVDKAAGDAEFLWDGWQVVHGVPAGLGEFAIVKGDFASGILRPKADHDAVREWPGLAPEVGDVSDIQRDLFADFALNRFFQRFPRLHEARHDPEAPRRELVSSRQQDFITTLNQHDDGR